MELRVDFPVIAQTLLASRSSPTTTHLQGLVDPKRAPWER